MTSCCVGAASVTASVGPNLAPAAIQRRIGVHLGVAEGVLPPGGIVPSWSFS